MEYYSLRTMNIVFVKADPNPAVLLYSCAKLIGGWMDHPEKGLRAATWAAEVMKALVEESPHDWTVLLDPADKPAAEKFWIGIKTVQSMERETGEWKQNEHLRPSHKIDSS